ncbi:MAG: phage portal protein [Candidatus Scalindua sp.]|jgi:hypothetical protein|nr:phage portal protein [Candidatus Scalindua sp.]
MIERGKAIAKWEDDIDRRLSLKENIAFYNDTEDYIISKSLEKHYPGTHNSLKRYLTTYPLTRRIIDDVSLAFKEGLNVSVESSGLNNLLTDILEKAELNGVLDKVDHLSNLLYKVGIAPVYRDGKVELDIITPDNCFVEQRSDDPTKITKLYVQTGIVEDSPGKVETIRQYTVYDDTYRWTAEVDSEDGSIIGNGDLVEHGMGRIPVVWFDTDKAIDSFWVNRSNSIVKANKVIDTELTNFRMLLAYQAFSVFITSGLDEEVAFTLSPDTYINLPYNVTQDNQPKAEFITPDARLDEYWRVINDMIVDAAQSMGLSVVSYKRDASTFNSGYQLKLSKQDVIDRAKRNRVLYTRSIHELLTLIVKTHNLYESNVFADNIEFVVDFPEFVIDANPRETADVDGMKLGMGLTSRVLLLMRDNPDLTRDQAIEAIKQIDIDNSLFPVYSDESSKDKNKNKDETKLEDL